MWYVSVCMQHSTKGFNAWPTMFLKVKYMVCVITFTSFAISATTTCNMSMIYI